MENMISMLRAFVLAMVLWPQLVAAGGYDSPQTTNVELCNANVASRLVTVGASTYYRVDMQRRAEGVSDDPTGIWGRRIANFNNPNLTDIWVGQVTSCEGSSFVVSQFINRQCSDANTCPTRVLRREASDDQFETLIGFKQACTDYSTYLLRTDGRGLMACGQQLLWR